VTIAENVDGIRDRIAAAAVRAGRDPASVRLVGVVKGATAEAIAEACNAGLRDFGENFVQEATQHRTALKGDAVDASWHLIGHLQRNKISAALRLFATIQSVDSLRLAEELSDRASARLKVLLEVNVAAEASKHGISPAEVASTAAAVGRLPRLELAGLMTLAPAGAPEEQARAVFRELRELAQANGLTELSMGMTDDFEIAVEEGATIGRIGRAIFGERPA
jgi:pyridoxal phosphate enzyme (YggS family)